jgi:hypothetical protein
VPEQPSGVWALEDDAGELVWECGRCGEGWYTAADDSLLEDEMTCRGCSLELYQRSMPRRRPAEVDNGRSIELWRAEQGLPATLDDRPGTA